jgi:hypothetical protein
MRYTPVGCASGMHACEIHACKRCPPVTGAFLSQESPAPPGLFSSFVRSIGAPTALAIVGGNFGGDSESPMGEKGSITH